MSYGRAYCRTLEPFIQQLPNARAVHPASGRLAKPTFDSMLNHITLAVVDYERSKLFYERTLAPLELKLLTEYGSYAGFGQQSTPCFWIGAKPPAYWNGAHRAGMSPIHIAFTARDRATVDAFYAAGIAAGAKNNGPPGPGALYHPHYYGAYILDPDGNNIEAVCLSPM